MRLGVGIGLALVLATPAASAADGAPSDWRPFAPDSLWNLKLRPDAPLHSRSAEHVAWLKSQVAAHGAWLNTTSCGTPQFWAEASTPLVPVALDHPSYMDPALIRAWSKVPMPSDAKPANCSDKNFSVLQKQPDGTVRQWEFWSATKRPDGTWIAKYGGAHENVAADRGVASALSWTDPGASTWAARASTPYWNVTATSISQDAGVIRQAEFAAGRVDHAIAIALHDAAKGRFLWPAQRTDGTSLDVNALPEGARLQLDPSIDVDSMTATPLVKMLARAAQNYGLVVRDKTYDATVFYGEEPRPGQPDAMRSLLGASTLASALKAFPWSGLRVLDAPECTKAPCTTGGKVAMSVDGPAVVGSTITVDTSNSLLDQPREAVRWDLDGDGSFEADGGVAVQRRVLLARSGPTRIGVEMLLRGGQTVTQRLDLNVAATTPVPIAPTSAATSSAPRPAGVGSSPATASVNPSAPAPASVKATVLNVDARGRVLIRLSNGGVVRKRVTVAVSAAGGRYTKATHLVLQKGGSKVIRITLSPNAVRALVKARAARTSAPLKIRMQELTEAAVVAVRSVTTKALPMKGR